MWYQAVGKIISTVHYNAPSYSKKNEMDQVINDLDKAKLLINQSLTNCARQLCFEHGLFNECKIVDDNIVSGEIEDYYDCFR